MTRYPGMEIIERKLEGWDCPKVEACADEERRGLLLDPNKVVIQKEQIRIQFRIRSRVPYIFHIIRKVGLLVWICFAKFMKGIRKSTTRKIKKWGIPVPMKSSIIVAVPREIMVSGGII
jgi:hypothetical protein